MVSLKQLTLVVFLVNLLLVLYTVYVFYAVRTPVPSEWPDTEQELDDDDRRNDRSTNDGAAVRSVIEIWSKAAIGSYLWDTVLSGKIESNRMNGVYVFSTKTMSEFQLKYRSGPSLTPQVLRQYVPKNLVLVLNGRAADKVTDSKQWLEELRLLVGTGHNVGLVVLGNENCFNHWLQPYLVTNGGFVKFLFIVYDWAAIDDQVVYQWPLGVATYRHFPVPTHRQLLVENSRPYACNFFGTIYSNTSREGLAAAVEEVNKQRADVCLMRKRMQWLPDETTETLSLYTEALRLSDLTLNPIGMNHECYRIYEALTFGSIPVVEENLHHVRKSNCDKYSALRLLKQYDAPVIYVNDWKTDLDAIVESEMQMSQEDKVQRRINAIKWYYNFKQSMKEKFFHVVRTKFKFT